MLDRKSIQRFYRECNAAVADRDITALRSLFQDWVANGGSALELILFQGAPPRMSIAEHAAFVSVDNEEIFRFVLEEYRNGGGDVRNLLSSKSNSGIPIWRIAGRTVFRCIENESELPEEAKAFLHS